MNRAALGMLLLAVTAALAPRSAAAAPAMAEVRDAYQAGKYRETLKMIAECLAVKGAKAEGYDRYELLVLKGESLVRLKSPPHAAHAFEDAQAATDDPSKRAAAMAAELVLRRSPSLKYVPKTGSERTPLSVVEPDSRAKAMTALRADLLTPLKSKIDRALASDQLTPTMNLLSPLREVAVLEPGATGGVEQTKPVLTALGTHARELIVHELKSQHEHVEQLNAAGNDIVLVDDFISRRGLHTDERRELAGTADYLRRIEDVSREGRRIAQLLGGDVEAWDSILNDAGDLVIRIESILNRPG